MPYKSKKSKKGGKNSRRGPRRALHADADTLIFRDIDQAYCMVQRKLGGNKLQGLCYGENGATKVRLCVIRGNMRNRVYINEGDLILVGLRDYEDAKCDVLHKYTPDQARDIRNYEKLPQNDAARDYDATAFDRANGECAFVFENI